MHKDKTGLCMNFSLGVDSEILVSVRKSQVNNCDESVLLEVAAPHVIPGAVGAY